jgi:hypothetical protein
MTEFTCETSERVARAGRLLTEAGFAGDFDMVPMAGGANSKVFRIAFTSGAPPLFFKQYFFHPDDMRDRLGAEYSFVSFAWGKGLKSLARPFAMDREGRCALYAFLEGRKLQPHEISHSHVAQCLQFYEAINACKESPEASLLPTASEACFCLRDHWQCLRRRIERLKRITPNSEVDEQALAFIQQDLAPLCADYLAKAHNRAAALGLSATSALAMADSCLSPSDFGFHNVLQSADGTLCFLDFEYAGWDDPAKTICDFFCQPACPVPMQHYARFADTFVRTMSNPNLHRSRFDLLLPLYQLKWCCIMLNDFLPSGSSRRRFALHDLDESARKYNQICKSRKALVGFLGNQSNRIAV